MIPLSKSTRRAAAHACGRSGGLRPAPLHRTEAQPPEPAFEKLPYDITTRRLRHTLVGHRFWIKWLGFSPDSKTLITGANNKTIKFWDVATGQEKTALEQEGGGETLSLSPDGTQLALGLEDGTVEVRDLASRQKRLYGHNDRVISLAFSPDGRLLASASRDRTVKLWDLRFPRDFPSVPKQEKRVWCVAFSPDGKLLASAGDNQPVKL